MTSLAGGCLRFRLAMESVTLNCGCVGRKYCTARCVKDALSDDSPVVEEVREAACSGFEGSTTWAGWANSN